MSRKAKDGAITILCAWVFGKQHGIPRAGGTGIATLRVVRLEDALRNEIGAGTEEAWDLAPRQAGWGSGPVPGPHDRRSPDGPGPSSLPPPPAGKNFPRRRIFPFYPGPLDPGPGYFFLLVPAFHILVMHRPAPAGRGRSFVLDRRIEATPALPVPTSPRARRPRPVAFIRSAVPGWWVR